MSETGEPSLDSHRETLPRDHVDQTGSIFAEGFDPNAALNGTRERGKKNGVGWAMESRSLHSGIPREKIRVWGEVLKGGVA